MNKLLWKRVLCASGMAVLLLAFKILDFGFPDKASGYLAYVICELVYFGWFAPFVLNLNDNKGTGNLFIGEGIYYKGILVYTICSLVIVGGTWIGLFSFKLALVLALASLVLLGMYIYLSFSSAEHIYAVKESQDALTSNLAELKRAVSSLTASLDAYERNDDVRHEVDNLCSNLRYLSPSKDPEARNLEIEMLTMIKDLGNAGDDDTILRQIARVNKMFKQRKMIR